MVTYKAFEKTINVPQNTVLFGAIRKVDIEIEARLDKLDDLLINGEISEQKHSE